MSFPEESSTVQHGAAGDSIAAATELANGAAGDSGSATAFGSVEQPADLDQPEDDVTLAQSSDLNTTMSYNYGDAANL